MNARQKAKKYKRLAERNAAKAAAYDRQMRADAFRRSNSIEKRIRTLRIKQILPDFGGKEQIALNLGEFLIDNKLVCFEVSDTVSFTGK